MKLRNSHQVGIRLDGEVASAYQQMADARGVKLATFLKEVLTNNLHTIAFKNEVDRMEDIVDSFQKNLNHSLEKFSSENTLNDKYFEDFGGIYMMMLGLLMQQKVDREDIRGMQAKGISYANANFKGKKE